MPKIRLLASRWDQKIKTRFVRHVRGDLVTVSEAEADRLIRSRLAEFVKQREPRPVEDQTPEQVAEDGAADGQAPETPDETSDKESPDEVPASSDDDLEDLATDGEAITEHPDKPLRAAPIADWRDWATAQGIDPKGMTKQELIAAVG